MPRYGKKIYTLLDFGSDKIGVMYGAANEAGKPEVLAYAQKSGEGIVHKGEITDYNKLLLLVSEPLVPQRRIAAYRLCLLVAVGLA